MFSKHIGSQCPIKACHLVSILAALLVKKPAVILLDFRQARTVPIPIRRSQSRYQKSHLQMEDACHLQRRPFLSSLTHPELNDCKADACAPVYCLKPQLHQHH